MAMMRRPKVRRADDGGMGGNIAGGNPGGPLQLPGPPEPGDWQSGPAEVGPVEGGPEGGWTPDGRGGETPRDRATPLSPRAPAIHAGSAVNGGGPGAGGPGGPIGFQPLGGGGSRSLFGRNRGLQGGGLGLQAPMANPAESASIEDLIAKLSGGFGGGKKPLGGM